MKTLQLILLTCLLILPGALSAQDTLVTRTGDRLVVKEVYVDEKTVEFKRADTNDDEEFKMKLKDVNVIIYKMGGEDYYDTFGFRHNSEEEAKLSSQGILDCKKYYNGGNGAATVTFLTAAILTPVFGLYPNYFLSHKDPKYKHLNYPNPELMENQAYKTGYARQAKKEKRGKVIAGYWLGSVVFVGWFTLLIAK